jgi:hypothetical protein
MAGMRYRLEVRLSPADVGQRVVNRWRPGQAGSTQMTDVVAFSNSSTPDHSLSATGTAR